MEISKSHRGYSDLGSYLVLLPEGHRLAWSLFTVCEESLISVLCVPPDLREIVFIIQSQSNHFHVRQAERRRDELLQQAQSLTEVSFTWPFTHTNIHWCFYFTTWKLTYILVKIYLCSVAKTELCVRRHFLNLFQYLTFPFFDVKIHSGESTRGKISLQRALPSVKLLQSTHHFKYWMMVWRIIHGTLQIEFQGHSSPRNWKRSLKYAAFSALLRHQVVCSLVILWV